MVMFRRYLQKSNCCRLGKKADHFRSLVCTLAVLGVRAALGFEEVQIAQSQRHRFGCHRDSLVGADGQACCGGVKEAGLVRVEIVIRAILLLNRVDGDRMELSLPPSA